MHRRFLRAASFVLTLLLSLNVFFTACSPDTQDPGAQDPGAGQPAPEEPGGGADQPGTDPEPPGETPEPYPDALFEGRLPAASAVGMRAEYLGTAGRTLPEVSDGGLPRYPRYGVTLEGASQEEKQAILDENASLVASSSAYDGMDEEGNLLLGGSPTGRKLYKHTAAAGLYEGDVDDSEPALVKRLTYRSRARGNLITGLYAPAGEVVRVELSESDLAATGGLTVYIGQVFSGGGGNDIAVGRDFNRMPALSNAMTVTEPTAFVGSFFGGPVYVRPRNAGAEFSVTITGAVAYSHYILGYTTEREFARNAASSAPYFDLEVWEDGVRHSGPKTRAERFDYAQLTAAAVLWDKIALVSNKVPAGSPGDGGIVFLYDPFVRAGSMVALVGAYSVNCPLYCLTAALDEESAVDDPSDAFWGCVHEFNHHFQRYGFAPGDEVTNNALSLVEYSLFTRVSARRRLGNADEGSYAVGWNRYANPSWSLRQTLAAEEKNNGLDGYANLLHAFGQEAFIRAAQNGGGSGGADAWFAAVCDATGCDMTYYFTEILHQTVSPEVLSEYADRDLPMFVPAASIYQTGRADPAGGGAFCRTAQPYGVAEGEPFTFDLRGSVVLPEGFSFTIRRVTQPAHGTLEEEGDGVYTYTPAAGEKESGDIFVTLSLQKTDGAFAAEDVTLVLGFREQPGAPGLLERTVYTYAEGNMYASAQAAYEAGYAGYETADVQANVNRVQNGNAEIWEPQPSQNAVMELCGKFRVEQSGRYRVALRGRRSAALYLSEDGQNYVLAAALRNDTNSAAFDLTNAGHYADRTFAKGQWVYFKAVLLVTYGGSFIGVGLGRFDGDEAQVGYLSAVRAGYERESFGSDYFYRHEYAYEGIPSGKGTLVSARYSAWDENYGIGNLFDGNDANFIHSDRTPVSAENPFEVVADLGRTVHADTFTIYGEASRAYQPKNFRLYGGGSPEALELLAEVTDAPRTGNDVVVSFEERDLRFYKLVVTDTWDDRIGYLAYRCAEFSYALPGGSLHSPSEERFVYRGGWQAESSFAPFGHVYVGENASLEFAFTGTRFAVFADGAAANDFEVLVDGAPVAAVSAGGAAAEDPAYLSALLPAGEHTVTLRGKTPFRIAAVALWP